MVEITEIPQEIRDQIFAEARQKVIADWKSKPRIPYLMPTTRYAKTDAPMKLVKAGNSIGVHIPKDVVMAMGLQRGQVLRVTLELFPNDAEKLFSKVADELPLS